MKSTGILRNRIKKDKCRHDWKMTVTGEGKYSSKQFICTKCGKKYP